MKDILYSSIIGLATLFGLITILLLIGVVAPVKVKLEHGDTTKESRHTSLKVAASTAGATVAAPRDWPYYSIRPVPIVLISQSGRWSITHDAAMAFLSQMWSSTRHRYVGI